MIEFINSQVVFVFVKIVVSQMWKKEEEEVEGQVVEIGATNAE